MTTRTYFDTTTGAYLGSWAPPDGEDIQDPGADPRNPFAGNPSEPGGDFNRYDNRDPDTGFLSQDVLLKAADDDAEATLEVSGDRFKRLLLELFYDHESRLRVLEGAGEISKPDYRAEKLAQLKAL